MIRGYIANSMRAKVTKSKEALIHLIEENASELLNCKGTNGISSEDHENLRAKGGGGKATISKFLLKSGITSVAVTTIIAAHAERQ